MYSSTRAFVQAGPPTMLPHNLYMAGTARKERMDCSMHGFRRGYVPKGQSLLLNGQSITTNAFWFGPLCAKIAEDEGRNIWIRSILIVFQTFRAKSQHSSRTISAAVDTGTILLYRAICSILRRGGTRGVRRLPFQGTSRT